LAQNKQQQQHQQQNTKQQQQQQQQQQHKASPTALISCPLRGKLGAGLRMAVEICAFLANM